MRHTILFAMLVAMAVSGTAVMVDDDPIQASANRLAKNQSKGDIIAIYNDLPLKQKEALLFRWRQEKRADPALTKRQFKNLLIAIRSEARKDYGDIDWGNVDP